MSSVTDLSSSSIKTQLKNNRNKPIAKNFKEHTESFVNSISEDLFDEEKILTSLILNNEATENYSSKFISESFDSDSTTLSKSRSDSNFKDKKSSEKKKSKRKDSFHSSSWSSSSSTSPSSPLSFTEQYSSFKSKEVTSSKNKYSQDFESFSEETGLNTELEEFLNLSKFRKQQLKKQDNIKYFTNKIKVEQKNLKTIKKYGQHNLKSYNTDKNQVNKLIERVKNYNSETSVPHLVNQFKIDKNLKIVQSEVVNRLDAVNSIWRTKREQEKKIQDFGDELNDSISQYEANKRAKNIFYKTKLNQLNSKLTNENYSKHEVYYCDSLMLIGNLASYLPKPSDSKEDIWNKLIAPLNNK